VAPPDHDATGNDSVIGGCDAAEHWRCCCDMDTETTQQVDVITKYWNNVDLPSIKVCSHAHLLISKHRDQL